jgi:surface antigen
MVLRVHLGHIEIRGLAADLNATISYDLQVINATHPNNVHPMAIDVNSAAVPASPQARQVTMARDPSTIRGTRDMPRQAGLPNVRSIKLVARRGSAVVVSVAAMIILPATASAAPAQTTHSTPTYAAVPKANWPCPATQTYACTTGGYAGQNTWGYGGANASYDSAGRAHNCTLYAAFKLAALNVLQPSWSGNADAWANKAFAAGTPVDQSPSVGSIAQWNAGTGHVAYVESVDPDGAGITITEDNYVPANAAYYPGGYTGTVHLTRVSSAWPDNFIHFTDATNLPSPPASQMLVIRQGSSILQGKVALNDSWTVLGGLSGKVVVAGNRLTVLTPGGELYAKDGLNGNWFHEAGGVSDYATSG